MTIWILLRDLMRPNCQAKIQLTQDAITDEQYCHATKVWGTFNLLLADVFENFRSPFAVLQIRPMSLLYITRIELGCNVKNDRHKIGVND